MRRPPGAGAPGGAHGSRRLLVAHPSPDLYGSDRQLVETVRAAAEAGWLVEVDVPHEGPLVELLRSHGADVRVEDFPVLRKAVLRPRRLVRHLADSCLAVVRIAASLRRRRPDVVYVNTLTIPVWLLAARLARVPVVCHVHEAEEDGPRVVTAALVTPLVLAHRVMANSAAARRVVVRSAPWVRRPITVVHNGVPGPAAEPRARTRDDGEAWILATIARLSPRKGVDVAVDAVALLAQEGRDVRLVVCGTAFAGYEWYHRELVERTAEAGLTGRVELRGYVHPTWPVLDAADVVLVPSRTEPFGNTAVEGLLARRPVVASAVQGLTEVLRDGETGLLVPPDDPEALAAAVRRLMDDGALRRRLADDGRSDALARFGTGRYGEAVLAEL
ncbi:MAG: hypothetical protein JWP95_261, partial [Actinotalea sp.]|nr:hypothetical protein [Actinotalea sp.]